MATKAVAPGTETKPTVENTVGKFLKTRYKPQLKRLIARFSTLTPGEKGFTRSAARSLNAALAKFGLPGYNEAGSISEQTVGELQHGRKIRRDGLSLSLAYRLGVALTGQDKPENAIALFYLFICGLWSAEKVPASELLNRIQGVEMDSKEIERRLKALEQAQAQGFAEIKKLLGAHGGGAIEGGEIAAPLLQFHPLTKSLRELAGVPDEDIQLAIDELFAEFPQVAEDMRKVLIAGELPPTEDEWLNLSYLMNRLTGEMWPPVKISELARSLNHAASTGNEDNQDVNSALD